MERFAGQTVIVTGAAHGFGRAIAHAFAWEGANVWACDVNTEGLGETARLVYHDGLTVDSPGTVEVCQPIDPDFGRRLELPEGIIRRVEPEHVEAWVTVSRAELAFPEIDEIYAGLDADLTDRGWQRNGAPREVYWGEWNDAAIDDPTCDVCFPVVPYPDEM